MKEIRLPLVKLLEHENTVLVNNYVKGVVFYIVAQWWRYGCKPINEDVIRSLANMRCNDWKRHKKAVLKSVCEITSYLKPIYEEEFIKGKVKEDRARRASVKAKIARQRKRDEKKRFKLNDDMKLVSNDFGAPVTPSEKDYYAPIPMKKHMPKGGGLTDKRY